MSARRALILSLIAILSLAAVVWVELLEPYFYREVKYALHDATARAGRTTPPNSNLIFLAIDSDSVSLEREADLEELYEISKADSVEARALYLMTERWPWSREVYALVLDRLVSAGAKVVVFDLTFPAATEEDEIFRAALDRHRDRVVIGSNFVDPSWRGLTGLGASHTRPPDSLVPQTTPMDNRVGFTNFWPDPDDTVRRAQYHVTFEQIEGRPPHANSEIFHSLAARALQKAGTGETLPEDLQSKILRFTAPPHGSFATSSLFEIFVPDYWQRNYRSGALFRDKIVVVGAHGNWQHDEHKTPFGVMPGPEIHLNAINAAIHGEFINEASFSVVLQVTVVAAFLAVGLSALVRSPWLRSLLLLVLNVLAAALAIYFYDAHSIHIPLVAPLAELNLSIVIALVADFAFERVEKGRLRRTFERYVSRDVVRELLHRPDSYTTALGGTSKPATILFSDLRGFTRMAAASTPDALVKQLNEYFTAMVECVFAHGGSLDKFIGDAVMAVWGNVRTNGQAADAGNAVTAALAMQESLRDLNRKWRAENRPELHIGIAVNHGEVVVGNVGSPQRMEFTVIGEVVNVTWRLQELTKSIGVPLIVSGSVARLIGKNIPLRSLGRTQLGEAGEIELFTTGTMAELPAPRAYSSRVARQAPQPSTPASERRRELPPARQEVPLLVD